jgi:hypothetical protein
MSTFYINPEAGNDANDGLSFANAWKTIDGATALRINPGDEIRIMESPAPTLVGTGLWTNGFNTLLKSITGATNATPIQITCANHGYANNDYVAIINVGGNTNANGIWQITNVSTNTFDLVGSTGNATFTSGGSVRNINSNIIKLTSAATKDIVLTDNAGTVSSNAANWTASANVTSTINATGWMPTRVSLAIAAGFTTGKAAYKTITSTDFSAYQQISLQFSQTSGTLLTSGDIKICLCSDTIGAVIVDEFLVPIQPDPYLSTFNIPITINKGSALGSVIQSIALYVVNDTGAITVSFSNVIAVKSTSSADNISLTSMIGKNNDEYFLPILGIKNNIILLFYGTISLINWTSLISSTSGYYGTTETVNTYKIEPFYALPFFGSTGATINNSGTAGNYISFSGGWNRTDMSTQTSSTYFSAQGGVGSGIAAGTTNYIDISKINLSKYSKGYSFINCTYCNFSDLCVSGNSLYAISLTAITFTTTNNTIGKNKNGITNKVTGLFNSTGIYLDNSNNNIIQDAFVVSCGTGIQSGTGNSYVENAIIKNCSSGITLALIGFLFSANTITAEYCTSRGISASNSTYVNIKYLTVNYIYGTSSYTISSNVSIFFIDKFIANGNTGPYLIFNSNNSIININSGTFGSIAPNLNGFITFSNTYNYGFVNFSNVTGIPVSPTYLYTPYLLTFTNCTDTSSNILNYFTNINDYKVSKDTSIYHGTTGTSWKIEQLSSNISQYNKIQFSIAKIAVLANKLTTISLWFKNSASTITGQLVCPGYQLTGTNVVANTVTSTTWQQLTITFTPTEKKVIEIFVYAYGSISDYLYVSDMNITQAS